MLASAAMAATSSRTAKHCMENNHLQQQDTNSEGQYVGSETRSKTLELPVIPPQSLKLKHGQDERKTEEQILSLREELLRGNVEQFVQRSFDVLTNSVPAKGMLLEIYRDLHLIYQFVGTEDLRSPEQPISRIPIRSQSRTRDLQGLLLHSAQTQGRWRTDRRRAGIPKAISDDHICQPILQDDLRKGIYRLGFYAEGQRFPTILGHERYDPRSVVAAWIPAG